MANIIDYIRWRGDLDFRQSAINEVDSLLFSELAYLNFSEIAESCEGILLSDAAREYFDKERDKFSNNGDLYKEEYIAMLRAMAASKRFGSVRLANYVQKKDEQRSMQFAAMTCELDTGEIYVAYRGTDDTLLGWKEDFLMAVMRTVPSQTEALHYLMHIAKAYPARKLYLGGHSKGGNLAVFAAVHVVPRIQQQIVMIYNHDGPGFKESLISKKEYQAVQGRIHTTVPQSSVVGMLLEHGDNYTVIKSNVKGARQHDGLTWEVCGPMFVRMEAVTKESRIANRTIRTVIGQMNDEQLAQFTESLFEVLSADKNKTITDIRTDGPKAVRAMLQTYDSLSREQRKALQTIALNMLQEGFHNMHREKRLERVQNKE